MLVRLNIDTTHLDARGVHYEQGKAGPSVRGDILEGRNWKHLDSGQEPEQGCMRENILEDSVTEIFLLVHDGPGHWVVEGAVHGVQGPAVAIEQHTGGLMKPVEDDFNFGSCYRFDNLFLHVQGCLLDHLHKAHLSEAASQSLSRRFQEECENYL